MPSGFIPNPLVGAEIARSDILEPSLKDVTDEIVEKARSIAPVETGTYRDSIEGEVGEEDGKTIGRVFSDVDYAPFLEFGTSDTPTFATLRRASEGP